MEPWYFEYMRLAYESALNSPDPSTQNGAILMSSGGREVIGVGCNDFPDGVDEKFWHGSKEDKYKRVVHAEASSLLFAARNGNSTHDSVMVCPWAACSNCAKHIAEAGVAQLIRHKFSNNGVTTGSHWYEDCIIGDEIMRSAGVEIIEVDPVGCGISLRRDGKLWTP